VFFAVEFMVLKMSKVLRLDWTSIELLETLSESTILFLFQTASPKKKIENTIITTKSYNLISKIYYCDKHGVGLS
jgi:hypothetical protein